MLKLLLISLTLFSLHTIAAEKLTSKFIDEDDGMLDASNWLASKYGFLPVPIIITGPTFGYGFGMNFVFLHDKFSGKKLENGNSIPPSMTGIMAAKTENDTTIYGAYHLGFWLDDKLRTTTFYGRPDAKMDFYPKILGREFQLQMNLEGHAFYQEVKFRLGNSRFYAGANYLGLKLNSSPEGFPSWIPERLISRELTATAIAAVLEYDSRDSIFTPKEGIYAKGVASNYNEAYGGDFNFMNYRLKFFGFSPILKDLYGAIRLDAQHVSGDAPYFLYPSIDIRGIAAGRYQGQTAGVGELELRWEFINRWSLIGFTGLGRAFGESKLKKKISFSDAPTRQSYGTGFRYELARKFGVHTGLDFAVGPEENSVYITMGSAWNAFF